MIRVLIADDHPVVRSGLAGMLGVEPDVEVVGEAADGEEAVALATGLRPDLVLMDLRMPRMDGAEATARIAREVPGVHVLVLTTYETDTDILRAVEAGATGYLLKDTPRDQFWISVKNLTADGYYTSKIGLRDELGYKGNTVLSEFPSCEIPEH